MTPARELVPRFRRAYERGAAWLFEGAVPAWVYAAMRVGLALIFLVRHADWLRPWLYFEHHRSVHGLAFLDSSARPPVLSSPLVPGLALSVTVTRALVYARTGLSVLLLLGVRARASAALLAFISYLLLAADRYRYFHHLHLLYVAIAWMAFTPLGDRWSVESALARLFRREPSPRVVTSPLWPLQLIRALVSSVYAAAGVSKLDWVWLSGDTLRRLEQFGVLEGSAWSAIHAVFGYAGVAWLACLTELALVPLLLLRRTRRLAVLLALGFHAAISASMPVYTFGAQLAVLLLAFWASDAGQQSPRLEVTARK